MVLVDTDVASFLFRNDHSATAYAFLEGRNLAISVVTLAEIEYGISLRGWGASKRGLMARYLSKYTVIPAQIETARIWATISSSRRKIGRPIGYSDGWIAATAIQSNLPLVTNNVRDLQHIEGLKVLTATS